MGAQRIVLRSAVQGDYEAINELATALVGFCAPRRAAFDSALGSADHALVVAEADGAVVGFGHLLTYEDLSHGAPAGELLGLVVREDVRRRGIGSALLHEVARLARERGVVELHISTEPENAAARRFYVGFDAREVGVQLELDLRRSGPARLGDAQSRR